MSRGSSLRVPAPAKLNLFLHVTGRRADGYHELQTVFQFLDWGDELTFTARRDGLVRMLNPLPGVPAGSDLGVRAAQALRERAGITAGCDIELTKRIPIGGGLGGGSSDAASALVALNRLWDAGLSEDELAAIGLTLGADVPVFVRGRAAWAEGIGEKLAPFDPPEAWYLLLVPPGAVNTRAMYAADDLPRRTPRVTPEDFRAGRTHNDFEVAVRPRHPAVAAALDWGAARGHTRMSGSGGTVFVECESRAGAEALAAQAPAGLRTVVARGANRSPLHRTLESGDDVLSAAARR